jgi:hypothetical protein
MGALDTIAIILLSIFCVGIISILWLDWREMARNEREKRAESRDPSARSR